MGGGFFRIPDAREEWRYHLETFLHPPLPDEFWGTERDNQRGSRPGGSHSFLSSLPHLDFFSLVAILAPTNLGSNPSPTLFKADSAKTPTNCLLLCTAKHSCQCLDHCDWGAGAEEEGGKKMQTLHNILAH